MNKNYLLSFAIIILISVSLVSATLNVSLSDQGTEVTNTTSGALLTVGDLTVLIYDALTGGNLVYNETFSNAVGNGSWNVMLGEIVNLPLEFGKKYFKDYLIAGEDASFVNGSGSTVGRQFFFSPLGDINSSKLFGAFFGASNTTNGTTGIVPAPQSGEQDKCLRGDGTWGSCATSGNLEYAYISNLTNIDYNTNSVIEIGSVAESQGLTVNTSNNTITLTAGKTYMLQAGVTGSFNAIGAVNYQFHDGSSFIGTKAGSNTATQGSHNADQETAFVVVTPSVNTDYHLQIPFADTALIGIASAESYIYVQEIGVGANDNSSGGGAFYGSLDWQGTASCEWNDASSSATDFQDYTADVQCDDNVRTSKGLTTSILTAGNSEGQLPQIKFDNLPSGYYKVQARGLILTNQVAADCIYRFSVNNGQYNSTPATVVFGGVDIGNGMPVGEIFVPEDLGESNISIQVATAEACKIKLESTRPFGLSVYYFPSFGTAKTDTVFSDLDGDTRINVDGDGSDSDNMTFFTAGTERMSINSNGGVNISSWADQSLSANGYARIGGLLIQWGNVTVTADSGQPITFPVPFTTVFQTYASSHSFSAGAVDSEAVGTDALNTTGMNVWTNANANINASWFAMGI